MAQRPMLEPVVTHAVDPRIGIAALTGATKVFGGTSLVTTAPAATTELAPTVTPPISVAPAAIHTFRPITIGAAVTPSRRRDGSSGWPDVISLTFGPISASSPVIAVGWAVMATGMDLPSRRTHPPLTVTCR